MKKSIALLAAVMMLIGVTAMSIPASAAPITSGNAAVDAEPIAGSEVTALGGGKFAITAPAGKLPIAVSADGKTITVASNEPVKGATPVTNYASNEYKDYITYRRPLTNTYKKLTEDKELTVVYFGGSVTMGYKSSLGGWRCLSGGWFKQQFPDANITLINAGLGESGTFMGTYRVQNDVIAKNPDLVFVEYAINDKYKGSGQAQAALQYETVVREIKEALPNCDIVTLLVTDEGVAAQLPELYPTAAGHAEMAAKYNIPVINVGAALINHMGNYKDKTIWNTYFWDGVHPKDEGYKIYFACLKEYLTNMLINTDYTNTELVRDVLIPVQSEHLLDGDRLSVFAKDIGNYIVKNETVGFKYSAETFNAPNDTPHVGFYYCEPAEGNKITFKFVGTELAIWTNFYNTSIIRYSVDGGAFKQIACDRHAPTQLVSGLSAEEHTITIEPKTYGSETNGEMRIGGLFIRNEEKQSVQGDVTYYSDYNNLTLQLPGGSYAVKYVPIGATASALQTPSLAQGTVFMGWKKENGRLLAATEPVAAGAVLTASVVESGHTHAAVTYEHTTRKHTGICSCGTVLEAESHDFGDWVITKPATPSESGEKKRTCSCGYDDVRTVMYSPLDATTTTTATVQTTVSSVVTTVPGTETTTTATDVSGETTTVAAGGETTTAQSTVTTAIAANATTVTTPAQTESEFPVGAVIGIGAAVAVAVGGAITAATVLKKKKAEETEEPTNEPSSDNPET